MLQGIDRAPFVVLCAVVRVTGGESVDPGFGYLVELPADDEGGFVGSGDVIGEDGAVDDVDYCGGVGLQDGHVVICDVEVSEGFVAVWYAVCDLGTYLDRKYFGFRHCLLRHAMCLAV